MLLLCDIGNSYIKTGISTGDNLSELNLFKDTENFFSYLNENNFNELVVSSVVPSKTALLKSFTNERKIKIFHITKDVKFNLGIDYNTPDTLGMDRISSAEGAFYLYQKSENLNTYNVKTFILSIDFGTAITINIIKYPGIFIGGVISPGLDMIFNSLHHFTSQLPLVDIQDFKKIIGDDTKSSIASGVVISVKGLVNEILNHLKKDFNASEIIVYITGGNAKRIIDFLEVEFIYERNLVLYGLKAIYDKNRNEN